ncbi:MAG: hypothetical protein HY758_06465 [Nitrospirae bacterium]|nr:hypothetical protein [Nitrospirota bacterium]
MPAQIGENLPADNLSDNSGGAAEANNATTDNSDLTGDSGIIEPAIPSTDAALSGYPTDDESMYNDNGGNSKIADSSLASLALPAAAGASSTSRSAATSASSFSALQISPAGNSGAAVTSIPIEVPPGRKGIQPNISLNYNSNGSNGWLGVGWSLDMGAIQRSNKRGVNYTANDYVVMASGSTSELVPIGNNYYSPKIEGAFSRYYKHPTGGWEVTTKDGVIYYYGSSIASRQDNAIGVFKWCLDKIQDTNGNFMTVTYIKDQGEIYLDQIDYTGNTAGLSPANYVKIYRESRPDAPAMYTSNFSVITAYRLKTIEVFANGSRARAYKFSYTSSGNTGRSLLASVQQYGSDALLDAVGTITYGTALPTLNFEFYGGINGFGSGWGLNVDLKGTCTAYPADFNGDGKHDPMRACNDPASNYVWKTIPSVNDLISSISNGIGGRTAISYKPSSEYSNTLLPFIVQTVNSTTTCDNYNASNSTCQGNTSATAYTYSGGYFDYAEREYRGFEYVKATAPNDTKTETWFKGCTYTNPPDMLCMCLLNPKRFIRKSLCGNHQHLSVHDSV